MNCRESGGRIASLASGVGSREKHGLEALADIATIHHGREFVEREGEAFTGERTGSRERCSLAPRAAIAAAFRGFVGRDSESLREERVENHPTPDSRLPTPGFSDGESE